MKTIRWGILGCGNVTEVKSGPGFQRAEGSALSAVMRRRGDLAADYARRHGVPAWYDDAEALVRDDAVDAVYIATPPGEHERLALAVCAAGKPCYVEKPMARNHAECLRMIAAFSRANVPLFVAYYRRALPRFRKALDLVASGALGRITGVTCRFAGPYHREIEAAIEAGSRALPKDGKDSASSISSSISSLPWRVEAQHSGGGLLLDLGAHTLDLLDFILGPLESVQGFAANVATPHLVEDAVAMTFRAAGGAPGTAHWNFASAERVDEISIAGDRAELRFSTFDSTPVTLREGGQSTSFDLANPTHIQQPLIQSIVDELRGTGRCDSTAVSAARTSAIIDTVLAGYYGTRPDGFWRTPERWPGLPRRRA